jgi:hypothetical protein
MRLQVDRQDFFVPDKLFFSSISYTKATAQEQLLPRSYVIDFFLILILLVSAATNSAASSSFHNDNVS